MDNIKFVKAPTKIKEVLIVCPYCKGNLVYLYEDYDEHYGLDIRFFECEECGERSKQIMVGGVV